MSGRGLYVGVLAFCGLSWGSTQALGKIAVSTGHAPFGLLFWNFLFGAALMGGLTALRGRGLVLTRRSLAFGLVVALVGSLVPGATFFLSIARLPAGVMSVLISSVPLLAFPIALALGQDRFSALRLLGLLAGALAVVLLAAPGAGLPDPAMAAFLPLALVGPLCYAIESNFVARFGMAGQDPLQAMALVCLIGAALALPLAALPGQWVDLARPWGAAEAALLAGAAVNATAYAAYVWLAARAGATFASQTSYVVTVSGVAWAAALLGESPSPFLLLALALMLLGLALVQPREARPEPA